MAGTTEGQSSRKGKLPVESRGEILSEPPKPIWVPKVSKPRPFLKNNVHKELLWNTVNHTNSLEAFTQLRGAAMRIETEQVFTVMTELRILLRIYENKTKYCKLFSGGKDNKWKDQFPITRKHEEEFYSSGMSWSV
ncbi:hypothetical protein IEQ34_019198 [Dendrobium chrysotoxum]|uniref:Uncharacterized protein n=1 Tax=Dendrobium chrysotoxum TaxID=161865 RepID=A0AAV7G7U4_DENCH|nr:hypothetical protein IEQ34_019198 [Dendrobium chrysotoxum]